MARRCQVARCGSYPCPAYSYEQAIIAAEDDYSGRKDIPGIVARRCSGWTKDECQYLARCAASSRSTIGASLALLLGVESGSTTLMATMTNAILLGNEYTKMEKGLLRKLVERSPVQVRAPSAVVATSGGLSAIWVVV